MKIKVIRNESEYEKALEMIESLMTSVPGSPQADNLELLSILIERYEEEHFPVPMPDPISAIEFRMDQQGLTRKDMQKYLGSQSKVSEVLSGKRPLSLSMIRKLHYELGIPAEVLLQEKGKVLIEPAFKWQEFPFTEMFNKGYFPDFKGSLSQAKDVAEELLTQFLAVFQGELPQPLYCKRSDRPVNENALIAWQAQVLSSVCNEKLPSYDRNSLNQEMFHNLVHLSYYDHGPQLVKEYLNKKGIHFVILDHLDKTHLDGATFLTKDNQPVIALTLRYDRLDNFWFTLLHELGHIYLHLRNSKTAFFDETIFNGGDEGNPQEQEANQFARNALLPSSYWNDELKPKESNLSSIEIQEHANKLEISPAIIAGRLRWENKKYIKYNDLLGYNQVREQLQEYRVNLE